MRPTSRSEGAKDAAITRRGKEKSPCVCVRVQYYTYRHIEFEEIIQVEKREDEVNYISLFFFSLGQGNFQNP